MVKFIRSYFRFEYYQTNFKKETLAGVTTFLTMAYIIIVNPKILESAGIPPGASLVATILTALIGTIGMGIYARRPFAIAPYMVENAFIAYTVVGVLGYTWQTALGAVFIGGVLYAVISLSGLRTWLAQAIPDSLKIAFAVGIGLFLTFIGLSETGIIRLGVEGAPVHAGNLHDISVLLSILCFIFIAFLMIKKITGALLIGILSISALAYFFNIADMPESIISTPPSLSPIFLQLDIAGAFKWGFFSVILTVLIMDFVDTTGTLLGLAYRTNLLDENGNLPEIEKPMVCDSFSTILASLLGTTTSGIYIESATGIEVGGRTGFTSIVTGLLFLSALFFAPFLTSVPPCAYGPVLIIVGMLMISPIVNLDFDDLSDTVPAFVVIVLMSFTYNLGIGMTAGFLLYPVMKIFAGRSREVHSGMWVLAGMSLIFFALYPFEL